MEVARSAAGRGWQILDVAQMLALQARENNSVAGPAVVEGAADFAGMLVLEAESFVLTAAPVKAYVVAAGSLVVGHSFVGADTALAVLIARDTAGGMVVATWRILEVLHSPSVP